MTGSLGGRPTKYTPEVQAQSDAYANGVYIERGDGVPSVAGLACYLGINRATLQRWRDKHPKFRGTLELIEHEQHRVALGKGITGEYNSTICKLVLANHGYSERMSQEWSGPDGGPIKHQFVAPDQYDEDGWEHKHGS